MINKSYINIIDFLPVKCYYLSMWEAIYAPSHGNMAARRLLKYALATVVAAFLWVLAVAPSTHAIDAAWNGASISYDGESYVGPATDKTIEDLKLSKGTQAYTYVEPPVTGNPNTAPTSTRHIRVLYFEPTVDVSVATNAKYRTYIYQGPSKFSAPSTIEDVAISPQSASTSSTSSCDKQGSLGWIICPVTGWLASGMDWVFTTLSGFLTVRPAESGQDSVLYHAWSMMRSIANVAFVIAFLIIIYSQLTTIGIDNYSMKKLLPRLIVAAVLVNISFYICSVAIDLSNILGYAFQDLFITIRNSLVGTSGNSWDLMSWESISGFILSGGTVAVAGGIAAVTTISTFGIAGSIFLLLPSLLVGLMAVLTALIVMAARQAVITILVIVAPLAFVAYLLPNTEKWFEKWQSTFMTLLVLFPAFSLIFGGSQLAASAIIQNADSINQVILGMLVQVAPLLITPMLMKLSGSVVGKIAGIVNNPNKGIIDRTRNWTKDRSEDIKANRLGTDAKKYSVFKRNAQRTDRNRRARENKRKINEGLAENRYLGSKKHEKLHEAQHEMERDKKTTEERLSRDLSKKIVATPELLKKEMGLRVMTDESTLEKSNIDKVHEELKAGKVTDHGAALNELAQRSYTATRDIALTSIATEQAKRKQQANLSEALMRNDKMAEDGKMSVREYAAGIETTTGQDSALAFAINQQYEAEAKLVGERSRLIKQFKLNGEERQALAMGKANVTASAKINGIDANYDFNVNDAFARDAAIDLQLATGSLNDVMEIMTSSGTGASLEDYMKTISDGIPGNKLPDKAAWMSGVFIDRVLRGTITDKKSQREAIVEYYIKPGKFKPEQLSTNDADAIAEMTRAIKTTDRSAEGVSSSLASLSHTIDGIIDEDSEVYKNTSEASRKAFRELQNMIANPSAKPPKEKYPPYEEPEDEAS